MNDRYVLAAVIGLAAIAVLASPQPAEACFCSHQCVSILEANALFEATVVAIEKPVAPDGTFIVRLADVRAVRGGVTPEFIIGGAGRYSIERIAPGVYGGGVGFPYPNESTPFTPARARTSEGATDIIVTPGADVQLRPIVVRSAPLVSVSGQVTGPLDDRVSDLILVLSALDAFPSARAYGGRPNASGRFTLSVHRGVRYLVRLEGAGRVGTTEFVAGDEAIEVLLGPRR